MKKKTVRREFMEKKLKRLNIMSLVGLISLETLLYNHCGIKVFALTIIPAALVFASIWAAIGAISRELSGK